jgi:hypothetical protein
MAHQVCENVTKWVDDTILQPVEHCIEQPCKWKCLCCNKWLCGIIWVLVVAGAWVSHVVCEIVADIWDIIVTGTTLVYSVATGDWGNVHENFFDSVYAFFALLVLIGLIVFQYDIFRFVRNLTK